MGEVNYKPLIDDMVWSFSRVEAYESCPHRWYLRYIRRCKERDKFYSSYGSFLHKLIEQYYNGELTKAEMLTTFLRDFKKEVRGFRPKESTLKKFIDGAVAYLTDFEPFPYKMVAVEKKVEFEIEGIKFVGYIDFLGQDESDGEFVVIDNKSRDRPLRTRNSTKSRDSFTSTVWLLNRNTVNSPRLCASTVSEPACSSTNPLTWKHTKKLRSGLSRRLQKSAKTKTSTPIPMCSPVFGFVV